MIMASIKPIRSVLGASMLLTFFVAPLPSGSADQSPAIPEMENGRGTLMFAAPYEHLSRTGDAEISCSGEVIHLNIGHDIGNFFHATFLMYDPVVLAPVRHEDPMKRHGRRLAIPEFEGRLGRQSPQSQEVTTEIMRISTEEMSAVDATRSEGSLAFLVTDEGLLEITLSGVTDSFYEPGPRAGRPGERRRGVHFSVAARVAIGSGCALLADHQEDQTGGDIEKQSAGMQAQPDPAEESVLTPQAMPDTDGDGWFTATFTSDADVHRYSGVAWLEGGLGGGYLWLCPNGADLAAERPGRQRQKVIYGQFGEVKEQEYALGRGGGNLNLINRNMRGRSIFHSRGGKLEIITATEELIAGRFEANYRDGILAGEFRATVGPSAYGFGRLCERTESSAR